jgi:hypothetical protein
MKGAIKLEKLQTIKNYAHDRDVTTSYIYKLIKKGRYGSLCDRRGTIHPN